MHHTTHHRCPRAGIDPITDEFTALSVVGVALHRPARDETIAVVLDDARCGVAIVVVAGTTDPDAAIEVVEFVSASTDHGRRGVGLIVASVRSRSDVCLGAPGRDDADRWLEMSEIADRFGVELVEWFVIDPRVRCPRDQLGEPPRW